MKFSLQLYGNQKLKRVVEEKLSEEYIVKDLKGISQRIHITGFSTKLASDERMECTTKMNSALFSDNDEGSVMRITAAKQKNALCCMQIELLNLSAYHS